MQVECLRKIQNQIDSNKNQMKSTVNIGNEMSDDEKVIFIKETISQGGIIEVTPSDKIIENQINILTSSNNICEDIINLSIPDEICLNPFNKEHTIIVLIHE
jgi:rRNA maturation endonuclease Nob1